MRREMAQSDQNAEWRMKDRTERKIDEENKGE
jgi:hypothetical protein